MTRRKGAALLAASLLSFGAAIAQAQTPLAETPEDFPPGPGREETFYICTACHSIALVKAQSLSRDAWADTISLMQRRHGLTPLDPALGAQVLDYLSTAFPQRTAPRGFTNPFLTP
ncbi:MAG: hypothetical protein EXQ88_00760 [Alphaproteobacteria bacterium]|nr:hypothetical protein [Alphaproteobacteria bacterium]